MQDMPVLGSSSSYRNGARYSYPCWMPIRPIVLPFPLYQHWYLDSNVAASEDSAMKTPSIWPYYLPGYRQSAFSQVPVPSLERVILHSDGSSDCCSEEGVPHRDSGLGDSFFSVNSSSSSRFPDSQQIPGIMEFIRSGRNGGDQQGGYFPSKVDGTKLKILLPNGKFTSSSTLTPLLPKGHCTLPLPTSLVTMDMRDGDLETSGGDVSPVNSPKKNGRPHKLPKKESPRKLRLLLSKAPPPGVQSPEVVMLPSCHSPINSPLSVSFSSMDTSESPGDNRKSGTEPASKPAEICMPKLSMGRKKLKTQHKRQPTPNLNGSGEAKMIKGKWRSFGCKTCGRLFQYPRSLLTHQLVHQDIRPHKCPFPSCSKAFRQTGHLQTHLLIHTGDKPFRCPVEGCPTPPFRHANRRCPIHTDFRLKKASSNTEKPLDLSNHPDTSSPPSPIAAAVEPFHELPSSLYAHYQDDMAQAALALLQFAATAVSTANYTSPLH